MSKQQSRHFVNHSSCKRILHLTLRCQWFDAIASGSKKVEYRAVTPHWISRLENRQYDEVHFRNGYQPDSPFMRVECLGIIKNSTYCIKLGKILEISNHEQ